MWHERPHAAAVADEREPALADRLALLAARREPGARPVEAAVAQHDAPEPPVDRRLEVADRGQRLAHAARRVGVERVVLGLDRPAGARIGPAREALRDEALDAGRARGREQVVGPLGAQPVGRARTPSRCCACRMSPQRRHLVDDRVGPRRRRRPRRPRRGRGRRPRPASAPSARSASAFSGPRVVPVTVWPRR